MNLAISAALATGMLFGVPAAVGADPSFDAVSVKPGVCPRQPVQFQHGRILAPSVPARILIGIAYGIPFSAWREGMIGGPDWLDSRCFSVEAHAEGNPPQDQMILMLRSFLADRFRLAVHWESRQLPVYALVVAKPGKIGPRLVPHAADNPASYLISPGHIVMQATLADLAKGLSWYQDVDRAVVDGTGLSGTFEISLDYSPSLLGDQPTPNDSPAIFTALQEQLGLKLERQKGPVEVLVIDHVEEPSAN